MIEIKSSHMTPVEFLGKEAWVQLLKYERSSDEWFSINIHIPEINVDLQLKGNLRKIADVLGDEVSVTFA